MARAGILSPGGAGERGREHERRRLEESEPVGLVARREAGLWSDAAHQRTVTPPIQELSYVCGLRPRR